MAKKQNKTFAQRAKKIIKSYKRADWDPIEKAALEGKLESLQQEQETYRQANGMDEYACGGKVHADGGKMYQYGGDANEFDIEPNQSIEPWMENASTQYWNPQSNINQPNDELEYSPYKTSIAPSLISGATSVLGNAYLANQQRGVDNINLPRLTHTDINLERGRQAASREAGRASQRIKNIAKGSARNRAEYMANRIAGESGVSSRLGEALSASNEKEDLVNINMRSGIDRYNAEMKAKETIMNRAQKIKNKAEREAYISAALGSVPQAIKDISAIRQQDSMINTLGDNYGWYTEKDPNKKWYQDKRKKVAKYRG